VLNKLTTNQAPRSAPGSNPCSNQRTCNLQDPMKRSVETTLPWFTRRPTPVALLEGGVSGDRRQRTHTEFTDLEVEPPWRDWRVLRHAFNFFGFIVHNADRRPARVAHAARRRIR